MWISFLLISLIVLLVGIICVVRKAKHNSAQPESIIRRLSAVVFMASVMLFIPIYWDYFERIPNKWFQVFFMSIHNAIRLFVVDSDFDIIKDHIGSLGDTLRMSYGIYSAILFVVAPIMTFGLVLSLFNNFVSRTKLLLNRKKHIYLFSALNENSILLAESIRDRTNRALVAFTKSEENGDDGIQDLVVRAKAMGALCLNSDIEHLHLTGRKTSAPLTVFFLETDESTAIGKAVEYVSRNKEKQSADVFLFSSSLEGEMAVSSLACGNIRLRNINIFQSYTYRMLFEQGEQIFDKAKSNNNISALIFGLGSFGGEFAKALLWFGQMEGFSLELHLIELPGDQGEENLQWIKSAKESCNTLLNGTQIKEYSFGKQLFDWAIELSEKTPATFIVIDTGKDKVNLELARCLRQAYARVHSHPIIRTVYTDSSAAQAISRAVNYKGEKYDIGFLGLSSECYSADVVFNSEVEQLGLLRHKRYASQTCSLDEVESSFWNNSYNYKSSIAAAIHRKMKEYCNVDGIKISPDKRTNTQTDKLRRLEHRRWSAFMLSEGYVYNTVRNDIAKTHPCLVPFDSLSKKDQEKDDEDI